jgi:hypothetical protein
MIHLILLLLINLYTVDCQCQAGYSSVVSAADTVVLVDNPNQCVRVMNFNGSHSVLAGVVGTSGYQDGPGATALFRNPTDVVFSPDNLGALILDFTNNRIRRVDIATGVVSTLAGNAYSPVNAVTANVDGSGSSATFYNMIGLTCSKASNKCYVSSAYPAVRAISFPVPVSVSTILGSASNGFGVVDGVLGVDGSIAGSCGFYPSDDETFFISSDSTNHNIRRLDVSSSQITTLAGSPGNNKVSACFDGVGTDARFNRPSKVLFYGSGVFIADRSNNAIRFLNLLTNDVSTFVGTCLSSSTTAADGVGVAIPVTDMVMSDDKMYIYAAQKSYAGIRRIEIATRMVTTLGGSTLPISAVAGYSIALKPASSTCLACAAGKYSLDGLTCLACPTGMLCPTTNSAPVLCPSGSYCVPGSNAATLCPAPMTSAAGSTSLDNCTCPVTYQLVTSNVSTVVVSSNHGIFKFQYSGDDYTRGVFSHVAGNDATAGYVDGVGAAAFFNRPGSMVTLPGNGDVLVVDEYNYVLRRVNLTSGEVSTYAGSVKTSSDMSTGATANSVDGQGAGAVFYYPYALSFVARSGTIFVQQTDFSLVRMFRSVSFPGAFVSTIFKSISSGRRDGILNLTGTVHTAWINPQSLIKVSGDGSFFIMTDQYSNVVRIYNFSTSLISTIGVGTGYGCADGVGTALFKYPEKILISSDNSKVFISEYTNNAIRLVNMGTLSVSHLVGVCPAAASPGSSSGFMVSLRVQDMVFAPDETYILAITTTGLCKVLLSNGFVSFLSGPVSSYNVNIRYMALIPPEGPKCVGCPAGFYCTSATSAPTACPPGIYPLCTINHLCFTFIA